MYGLERLYVWFGEAICLVGRTYIAMSIAGV